MRYLLAALSHGNPASDTAEACLDSFVEHVTPKPTTAVAYHDGRGVPYAPISAIDPAGGRVWQATTGGEQRGFCAATRALWRLASRASATSECSHVFWLEHDFRFTRPVNLAELAAVLDSNPDVAQMSLIRDAANDEERAAGGLVESVGGFEVQRERLFAVGEVVWLAHRRYFTTTPSLMRASFMQANPWPSYDRECEGRFGLDLIGRGFAFGAWGNGEPWVEHVGVRTGFGY